MLASIRRLVYWMGFRPKPGTVLYSPSTHYRLVAEDALKHIKWGMDQVITENTRLVRIVMHNCEVCGKPDSEKAMAFRNMPWCSENHRKIVQKDDSKRKTF